MAASLRMFRRQQFPREAQQIRIAARPSTSLRIDPGTSPVGFDRHAGRSSKPSAVSVRRGGRALDREKAPVIGESYARPDRSGSSGLSTARTSPRTALSTRVCVQSRRRWFHLVDNRQTASKITAHSPFRPRYAYAHLRLGFRSLLAEARSDANSPTNRLRMKLISLQTGFSSYEHGEDKR
jgi:hypothetical protein